MGSDIEPCFGRNLVLERSGAFGGCGGRIAFIMNFGESNEVFDVGSFGGEHGLYLIQINSGKQFQ